MWVTCSLVPKQEKIVLPHIKLLVAWHVFRLVKRCAILMWWCYTWEFRNPLCFNFYMEHHISLAPLLWWHAHTKCIKYLLIMKITTKPLLLHTNTWFFFSRAFELAEWITWTRMASMINTKKVCNAEQCLLDPIYDRCSCVIRATLPS